MLTWVFSLLFATDDCAENQIANEKIREIHGPAGPPVQFPYFSKINSWVCTCMQNSLDHSIQMFIKRGTSFIYFFSFTFCCLPCPAMYCHVLPYPTMSCHVLPCPQDMVLPWEELIAFSVKNSTFQLNRSLEQLGIFFVAMASPSLGLLRAIVEKQSDGSIGQKADMTWYIWRWTKREGVTLQWWFD